MSDNVESNQVPSCPGGQIYTIKPGDSFFSLAQRFNTTVQALITANPGVDPQNLRIGQQICIPVPPTPGPCPGGFEYVIKAGDTFFSIARRFGITVEALAAANPGVNPVQLQIGQRICVPAPQPPQPVPCPGGQLYTIRAGDTLFSLAQRFNTTVNAILAANPGLNPQNLQVGQVICIPGMQPMPCPGGRLYTIQAGDTLFSLAQRFNTTVNAILAANPGLNPQNLQIGQVICIR